MHFHLCASSEMHVFETFPPDDIDGVVFHGNKLHANLLGEGNQTRLLQNASILTFLTGDAVGELYL